MRIIDPMVKLKLWLIRNASLCVKGSFVRAADIGPYQMPKSGRMAASGKPRRSKSRRVERPIWAARAKRPNRSNLNGFRDRKRILQFDTQVSDRAIHLGVAE